ncbi:MULTISPECIES: hypothetical protein [unclassified Ensifer]|uniref:hypothetical protein n=1 Tax=unclassified Ensifer TaxID=2633371 RepID=UPI0008130A40|nr:MULTISPECIES: hypothetical protein [unclassified Ensifer]OCP17029.1 hypothetical protein BC360_12390 [Ensifer sp. LC163]OCP24142.1 hypothetical protein BC363_23185 [Ensifer sp. LC384]OCP25625.1 hypothetical protein BC361_17510 [Ensifer sp. LC54]
MQTTFIPTAIFDSLTHGLAANIAKLQPDMVSGQIAPHQIAELLTDYGIVPEDMMRQIIEDQRAEAAKQIVAGIPSLIRPAA